MKYTINSKYLRISKKGRTAFLAHLYQKYKESYCSRPRHPWPHSRHTALKFCVRVFQKFVTWQPLVRNHSYSDHWYPIVPAFIPWLLTPGFMPRGGARGQNVGHLLEVFFLLFCYENKQIVGRTLVSLVTLTCGSWSEGEHDLYFTVQWFCLISWKLFDVWTSYFGIMSRYDPMFDLKINVGNWPIFHGPVILPYILKTVWCMKIILPDYEYVWRRFDLKIRPGVVARSEACSLGMQAAPSSIPTSGTFFRGDLVMKPFLRPFSLFCWFKKISCQLLAKECALSTGKLPRRLAQEQCG